MTTSPDGAWPYMREHPDRLVLDVVPGHAPSPLPPVRIFLGTNLSQTGFSVAYERVAENVWFPATYGTEFRFNVLWGYKRTVTLSLESSGFRKTDVNSAIHYDADSADAQRNLTSNSKNP